LRHLRVEALSPCGDGLAREDGRFRHVPGALPGDLVAVDDRTGAVTVLEPSAHRVVPSCAHFGTCGGCAWQHASPELQAEAHLGLLRRALPPALRELPVAWHPSPLRYGYRTRARLAWERSREGIVLGFRARKSRDLVALEGCPVLHPTLQASLLAARELVRELGDAGELSLGLGRGGLGVLSVHPRAALTAATVEALPACLGRGFEGVALWAPGATAPVTVGDPRPVQRGPDGACLVLPTEGFAQANEALNPSLVATVVRRAEARRRRVLELYAGSGNFTLALAETALAVRAVESDPGAVRALEDNLRERGVTGVTVQRGDAAEAARGHPAEVVVLDPPRTGAREACEAVAAGRAKRVVYVSCDPSTLGRDLALLLGAFRPEAVDAFEMFPQTPHLEAVVTLRRNAPARW
jgi:23S rRNA (uracil1939-C5)-methyltransferase